MSDKEPPLPERLPEPGFYYHYKHADAAYEVIGTGWHTETGEFCVLYRPLYEGWALSSHLTYLRPVAMFMDTVEKPEYQGPRFIQITDAERVAQLKVVRDQLYGQ